MTSNCGLKDDVSQCDALFLHVAFQPHLFCRHFLLPEDSTEASFLHCEPHHPLRWHLLPLHSSILPSCPGTQTKYSRHTKYSTQRKYSTTSILPSCPSPSPPPINNPLWLTLERSQYRGEELKKFYIFTWWKSCCVAVWRENCPCYRNPCFTDPLLYPCHWGEILWYAKYFAAKLYVMFFLLAKNVNDLPAKMTMIIYKY